MTAAVGIALMVLLLLALALGNDAALFFPVP